MWRRGREGGEGDVMVLKVCFGFGEELDVLPGSY